MIMRVAIVVASLLATAPAMAQSMSAEAAQRFVAGKLFAFSCIDGSRGLAQVHNDGSVMGTIQVSGSGPVKSVGLPPGTFKVKGDAICAKLKGLSLSRASISARPASKAFGGRSRGWVASRIAISCGA